MSTSNPPQKANTKTEAEEKSVDQRAGQRAAETGQSSHDSKSHIKAGSDQGAGGGKKQQHHR